MIYRFLLLFFLLACTDDPAGSGPRIQSVLPGAVAPGAALRIEGEGFGDGGHVAIGGRALPTTAWAPSRIDLVVPADMRPGRTVLVVVSDGRPSAPAELEVTGDPRPLVDSGRVLPPPLDGGVDRGPPTDAAPADGGVPDAFEGGPLVAEFLSDPAGMGDIRLQQVDGQPGELVLEVVLPRDAAARWGLAFHLAWDRGLMTLLEASPAGGAEAHAAEIGGGRLAAGRLLDGRPTAFRLRFRLLGRGEGRLTFPVRYRTLRDRQNQPVAVGFAEGTLRVREVQP